MSRIGTESGTGTSGSGNLADKAQEVSQNIREMGSQVRDVAREQYDNLSSQARDYYQQGQQVAQQWEQSLEGYVREKPLQALLVAAGVGVLLGVLWKRS